MSSSSYIVPPPCILPKITQCSPRVWRILGCNPSPMTLGGTNTFLIGTGRSRILIDSGEGVPEYFDLLKEVVTKTQTECISHLLLTHWHHDHTKGCKDVLRLFPDCKVGKIKSRVMTNDKLEPLVFPTASESNHNNNNNKQLFDIEHGQEFETEGATIKAMFTPGHSDDHLIFYEKNEKAVFTGDCILGYGSSVFASFPDFMQSLHFIKQIHPVRLYPAHGPNVPSSTSDDQQTTTEADKEEKEEEKSRKETSSYIENYIHHRLKREGQVLKVLEKGENTEEKKTMNLMSIVDEVYGEQIAGQPKLRAGAAGNTLHILKKLVLENKVAVDFSEHNNSNNDDSSSTTTITMSEEEVQGLLDTTKDYSNDVYLARIAAEHQNKKEGEACSCSPEAQNLLLQKVEKLKWKLA